MVSTCNKSEGSAADFQVLSVYAFAKLALKALHPWYFSVPRPMDASKAGVQWLEHIKNLEVTSRHFTFTSTETFVELSHSLIAAPWSVDIFKLTCQYRQLAFWNKALVGEALIPPVQSCILGDLCCLSQHMDNDREDLADSWMPLCDVPKPTFCVFLNPYVWFYFLLQTARFAVCEIAFVMCLLPELFVPAAVVFSPILPYFVFPVVADAPCYAMHKVIYQSDFIWIHYLQAFVSIYSHSCIHYSCIH